jgi:hypothetical protein
MYCELTTQYWAWKNVRSDYVGFCHYRRYFNFTDTFYDENPYGEVMDGSIDEAAVKKYGLDDETIRKCVSGYDVITTGFHDLRQFPGDAGTPREQYEAAERLHYQDLEAVSRIVKDMHPDYSTDVDEFLDGHLSCFCNMYIMRNEIFSAYCEWLFPILERFCAEADMSHYSKEALRTPGTSPKGFLISITSMQCERMRAGRPNSSSAFTSRIRMRRPTSRHSWSGSLTS